MRRHKHDVLKKTVDAAGHGLTSKPTSPPPTPMPVSGTSHLENPKKEKVKEFNKNLLS